MTADVGAAGFAAELLKAAANIGDGVSAGASSMVMVHGRGDGTRVGTLRVCLSKLIRSTKFATFDCVSAVPLLSTSLILI